MSDAPEPEPSPAKPKRRFFPRFTLRTLTLCVLLAASGLGLWWKWEPWVRGEQSLTGIEINALCKGEPLSDTAPDGRVFDGHDGASLIYYSDAKTQAFDFTWSLRARSAVEREGWPIGFIGNDFFVFDIGRVDPRTGEWLQHEYVLWQRRRPEQWWGVACLPEFWLTIVFALLAVWSLARDFKTLRRSSVSHSNGGT